VDIHQTMRLPGFTAEPREPRPLALVRFAPHCFELTGGIVIRLPTAHSYVGAPLGQGSVGATLV
jgi:hypothetical protein